MPKKKTIPKKKTVPKKRSSNLTAQQKDALRRQAKYYPKVHIEAMKRHMRKGDTFKEAHEKALKEVKK